MLRKSLLCAALMLTACGQNATEGDAFREGLPSQETVAVKAPEKAGQGLQVEAQAKGGQSDTYVWTRAATFVVNGGTASVLTLLEKITEHTPTSLSENTAVWGPHTEALSPNTWKLTVTQTAEHSYSYVLEAKAKSAADSEYKTILSGSHTVATNANGQRVKHYGSGSFLIDWDAAQTLPEHDTNVGTAEIRYARPDATRAVTVEADFRQVRDTDRPGTRVDADYRYEATPGSGGEFDFAVDKNIDRGADRTALEHLTIKSRWQQNGAGRSDIRATGGDLNGQEAKVSECWDSNFASQVLLISYAPFFNYGVEANECAFTSAVYSSLSK